ncbi:MAG TPA: chemotaxis protein CheW [Nitrospirota bacterium]|nr:chemotaxis protein CheW [Nitrospirota bacterium]
MRDRNSKPVVVADETVQIVTFQVGTEQYGLEINSISEIVRPHRITPLPRMSEFIEGVINLRGTIIPIVDLRKRFALAMIHDNPRKVRMMITRGAVHGATGNGKELLGLVVDGVNEVIHVPKKDIETAPEAALGERSDFITGMGKVADRLIILLDITRILSQQERVALAEAGNAEP